MGKCPTKAKKKIVIPDIIGETTSQETLLRI